MNAIGSGNEVTLAASLCGCFNSHEQTVRGQKAVPQNAAQTFAEGEFNRFYARAVCRLAIEQGQNEVRIYRARSSQSPRPESLVLVGQHRNAHDILEDIRSHSSIDPALKLPLGPNSGLSVELVS
jgi:hypothetical protein